MLVRILSQIRFEATDELTNKVWDRINLLVQDTLQEISYARRTAIIGIYNDVGSELIQALTKVNTYRNEFAHKRPEILIGKYDVKSLKGKKRILDLSKALKKAEDLFLVHTQNSKACKYYLAKQLEGIQK